MPRRRSGPDDVGQPGGAELPVGALVAEQLGHGHGAAQAVADARGAGEQGERPRRAVGVAGPEDLAARRLQVEHEVDRRLDDRPHGLDEATVAGEQPVVPHTGRRVGDGVGVELVLLDAVGQVVLVPRAVGPLGVDQPLRRRARPRGAARTGRAPWPPRRGSRDRRGRPGTRGSCPSAAASRRWPRRWRGPRCGVSSPSTAGGSATAGPDGLRGRAARPARAPAWWRTRRGTCPRSGLRARSVSRVTGGADTMSHSRNLRVGLHQRVGVVGGAHRAAQPPVGGVQGVGQVGAARVEAGAAHLLAQLALGVDAHVAAHRRRGRGSRDEIAQQTCSGNQAGTVTAMVPPGRRTRTSSSRAARSSGTCSMTSEAMTRSKLPSANGQAGAVAVHGGGERRRRRLAGLLHGAEHRHDLLELGQGHVAGHHPGAAAEGLEGVAAEAAAEVEQRGRRRAGPSRS